MEKNSVNFTPRGSYILVTSNLVKKDKQTIYTGKSAPEIKEVQQVVAIGPEVRDVNIGDWVVLNMNNFIQTVKVKSQIKAGIGGMDMLKEEIVIPFFSVPGDENVYIKINSRELEGVINDYNKLPDNIKEFKTLIEFTLEQEEMNESVKHINKSKTDMFKDSNRKEMKPLLKTETGSGQIKM